VYFDILNRLGATHECAEQMEERTDFSIANAALHYVGRPIMLIAYLWSKVCNAS